MALTCTLAFAQEKGDKTLYIIDGVVSSKAAADELPGNIIRNMNIVKGIDKVVVITTKAGRDISGRVVDINGKPMAGVVVIVPKTNTRVSTDTNGYYKISLAAGEAFLNYTYADFPTKTVQVDKANMDDVVMDKNAPKNLVVLKDLNLNGDIIKVRGEKKTDGTPLYIVKSSDGNIKKVDNIDSISPNDIKTMNVFKGNKGEQFKEYGDTSNGVILIELK